MRRLLALLPLLTPGIAFAQVSTPVGWPAVNSDIVESKSALAMPILVTDFGADRTGVSPSDTAINQAISRCQSAGRGNITFPQGTYNVSTELTTITTSGCRIVAEPGTTIKVGGTATIRVFTFGGTGIGTTLALREPALAGASEVTVTDASRLRLGMRLLFETGRFGGDETPLTYQAAIAAIAGDRVTLTAPLPRRYASGEDDLVVTPYTSLTLSAPTVEGKNTFTTSDASALTVGGYVVFKREAPHTGATVPFYDFTAVVTSISGSAAPYTVTLNNSFPISFAPADAGLLVSPWEPITGVGVEGLTIDASGHTGGTVTGVETWNTARSRFAHLRGTKLTSLGRFGAGAAYSSYANVYDDLHARDSGDTGNNAILFLNETNGQYSTLETQGGVGVGWGIQWAGNSYPQASNISSVCQGASPVAGRNIKLGSTLYGSFSNIVANCSSDNGLAVSWGSSHNSFYGVVTHGNFTSEGVWVEISANNYNRFFGVSAYGNALRDIYVDEGSHFNEFFGVDTGILWSQGDSTNAFYGVNAGSIYNRRGSIIQRAADLPPQPNLLVNPGPELAQETAGSDVVLVTNTPAYFADGWQGWYKSPNAVTCARVVDGAAYALKCTNTGSAATGAGDYMVIRQPIEASFLLATGFGTPAAKNMCISGEVKTSIANYPVSVSMTNFAGTRSAAVPALSIPTANTWTPIAGCFPGDITGTWVTSGEAGGAYLYLTAASGSTFVSGQGQPLWGPNNYIAGNGTGAAMMSTDGASISWRNVKLEVSPGPTPYRRRDPASELVLAQRYYEKSYDPETKPGTATGLGLTIQMVAGIGGAQTVYVPVRYKTPKRCGPAGSALSTWSSTTGLGGANTAGKLRLALAGTDVAVAGLAQSGYNGYYLTTSVTTASADILQFQWVANCRL